FDAARPVMASLEKIIGAPDMCSKRWVWEQYDNTVMGDTVQRPGGDAAVVRVHNSKKGLAITTDVSPRYCRADPFEGAKQAVAEAWRNLTAVGAKPLAVTDNLNFGNPEKPETMGEIVAGIDGIGEACRALDFPVVSGNCSLYNETQGEGILPTPTIGAVGLMADINRMATVAFKRRGDAIVLIGETQGHLGQSIYLRDVEGKEEGAAPRVDLAAEKKHGDFVRGLIEAGRVDTVHDISDGGLLVAVAEMALAGNIGATLAKGTIASLFGEDQARYVLAAPRDTAERLVSEAKAAGIAAALIGTTGGGKIAVEGSGEMALDRLRKAHETWFPSYMAGEL
ncbi:MAG: phosphoribosylformylglycinamidine synthase II, partial [Alphaproteobacteria bacterium]|nr:phosphoribosylformylglycinamidine synthase II [Alphaproteobacteria bacterium]